MQPAAQRLISGTRISMIVGVSPYGDALTAYEEIVHAKEGEANHFTARGNMMEPVLRRLYVARTGAVLRPKLAIASHDWHDWATCSVDDLIEVDGLPKVIDYKSANRWTSKKWGQEGSDNVPLHYEAQVRWNMFVCDEPAGEDVKDDAGQYTGEFDLRFTGRYLLERDLEREALLVEAGERFWFDHVVPRVTPIRTVEPKKRRKAKAAVEVA